MDVNADMLALVAATWLLVRAARPYLNAVTTRLGLGLDFSVDGKAVFAPVLLAAFAVAAIEAQVTGTGVDWETARQALLIGSAAIGADQVVKRTG